jgi:hypothetical protein
VSHRIEKILFYFPEFLVEKRLENHYQDIGLLLSRRLTTVLSRDSLKRVERWSGRGSVDLVVLRSSLISHLA